MNATEQNLLSTTNFLVDLFVRSVRTDASEKQRCVGAVGMQSHIPLHTSISRESSGKLIAYRFRSLFHQDTSINNFPLFLLDANVLCATFNESFLSTIRCSQSPNNSARALQAGEPRPRACGAPQGFAAARLPSLAGAAGEAVDSSSHRFLTASALEARREKEKAKEKKAKEERKERLMQIDLPVTDAEWAAWREWIASSSSSTAGKKRKKKEEEEEASSYVLLLTHALFAHEIMISFFAPLNCAVSASRMFRQWIHVHALVLEAF